MSLVDKYQLESSLDLWYTYPLWISEVQQSLSKHLQFDKIINILTLPWQARSLKPRPPSLAEVILHLSFNNVEPEI